MSSNPTSTTGATPPPKTLQCNLCGPHNSWRGPLCPTCPSYRMEHYAVGVGAAKDVDYFCVAESPHLSGPSGSTGNHQSWSLDIEKLVKTAFINQKDGFAAARYLQGRFTYAVRCAVAKPNKKMKDCCNPLFVKELLTLSRPKRPIMIFALGPSALQSLGIKVGKYSEMQGKFFDLELEGREVVVFASLTKRQLPTKTGYFAILRQHIDTFLAAAADAKRARSSRNINPALPLQTLIKDYRFPKTLKEVGKLVDEIILYSSSGANPENSMIAIDTETNTLYPHRKKLKILNLLVAWDDGKAAAIPIEHEQSKWGIAEVFPYIQQLLGCSKPKVFHNAKYDIKVLQAKGWKVKRFAWDTLVGEHLLAEDKRGFYGLKPLTKTFLPPYSGYEDELAAIREKAEQKLKKAAAKEGKTKVGEIKGAAKKLANDDGFASIPLKILNEYGAVDADVTRQICKIQRARMAEEDTLLLKKRNKLAKNKFYRPIAMPGPAGNSPLVPMMYQRVVPVTKTLADMEAYGIAVDLEYVDDLADKMDKTIIEASTNLTTMVPPGTFSSPFNPNSPAHLIKLFFVTGYHPHLSSNELISYQGVIPEEELRITDGGQISTDAAFLKKLKAQYNCKFATALLEYRAITKARNTFVENIRVLSREDGRMHTSFNISGTSTGRLSSSDENMQNVPGWIKQHNIKKIFIPSDSETMVIVNADAKAAEVRIYAAYSKDANLIQALCDGMDPHSFFSSVVMNPEAVLKGVPPDKRTDLLNVIGIDAEHDWSYEDFQAREDLTLTDPWYGKQLEKLRKNIKRVVFGILYGASKNKISAIVGIPHEQAQAIIDVLFRMFPTIPKYIQDTKDQVRFLDMVDTFVGRRRRLELRKMTRYLQSKAERQAVNFKIQSTSSEIVLDVLCKTDGPIRDMGGRLLITVHDSLVFELPKQYVSQMPDFIKEHGVTQVAKDYPWLPVPFSWDVEVGPSYGELQSVDRYLAANPIDITSGNDYEDLEILNDLASA